MKRKGVFQARHLLIWAIVLIAMILPLALAAASPLLAWRDPIYIVAGFAGVLAMLFLLLQPLLAGGKLPGVPPRTARSLHRLVGGLTVGAVTLHVIGLWITSPPDVIDALLFRSPTAFSAWGVIALTAVLASALLAVFRKRLGLRPKIWRRMHASLAIVIVGGTIIHALLIEGTMEPISKALLSALLAAVTLVVVVNKVVRGNRQS